MAAALTWQNRITRYGDESPDVLLDNPSNYRVHPKAQADALAGVLSEVGLVQNIIYNERTKRLVDGHLRVELARKQNQPTVPVTYVDLSPEEEALILATLDPISAMATHDADKLRQLLDDVSTGDAAVMAMLSELAEDAGIVPPDTFDPNAEWIGMPEFEQEDAGGKYRVIVHIESDEDLAAFEQAIGHRVPRDRWATWYPQQARADNRQNAYVVTDDADAA